MRPAIDTFVVPESNRLYASSRSSTARFPVNGCSPTSLARMYAALAAVVLDGERFLSTETLRRATEIQGQHRHRRRLPDALALGYHLAATTEGHHPNGFGHFGTAVGAVGRPETIRGRVRLQSRGRHAVRRPALPARRRAGADRRHVALTRGQAQSGGRTVSRGRP